MSTDQQPKSNCCGAPMDLVTGLFWSYYKCTACGKPAEAGGDAPEYWATVNARAKLSKDTQDGLREMVKHVLAKPNALPPQPGATEPSELMHEWMKHDSPQFDIDPEKITERLAQENDVLCKQVAQKDAELADLRAHIADLHKAWSDRDFWLLQAERDCEALRDQLKERDERIVHLLKELDFHSTRANNREDQLKETEDRANAAALESFDRAGALEMERAMHARTAAALASAQSKMAEAQRDTERLDWLEKLARWNDPTNTARITFPVATFKHCTLRAAIADARATGPEQPGVNL